MGALDTKPGWTWSWAGEDAAGSVGPGGRASDESQFRGLSWTQIPPLPFLLGTTFHHPVS